MAKRRLERGFDGVLAHDMAQLGQTRLGGNHGKVEHRHGRQVEKGAVHMETAAGRRRRDDDVRRRRREESVESIEERRGPMRHRGTLTAPAQLSREREQPGLPHGVRRRRVDPGSQPRPLTTADPALDFVRADTGGEKVGPGHHSMSFHASQCISCTPMTQLEGGSSPHRRIGAFTRFRAAWPCHAVEGAALPRSRGRGLATPAGRRRGIRARRANGPRGTHRHAAEPRPSHAPAGRSPVRPSAG